MKKIDKLIVCLLTVLMMISSAPLKIDAEDISDQVILIDGDVEQTLPLEEALKNWTDGTTIKLINRLETASSIVVSGFGKRTLDLNGYGILYKGTNGPVIILRSRAELNVIDSYPDTAWYVHINGNHRATSVDKNAGGIEIKGGYIAGGYEEGSSAPGSGILLETRQWATINLYGGNIIGNRSDTGGGICSQGSGGNINIYGGNILYNYGEYGGGIYQENEIINISGGEITNNISLNSGTAVFARRYATINISGGLIANNTSTNSGTKGNGGAVEYEDTAKLNISGNPVIRDNTFFIGKNTYETRDIYIPGINYTFNISGKLSADAQIGVYCGHSPVSNVFAKNYLPQNKDLSPSKVFYRDVSGGNVECPDNGELSFVSQGDNYRIYTATNSGVIDVTAETSINNLPASRPGQEVTVSVKDPSISQSDIKVRTTAVEREIRLEKEADNKYSFTMPDSTTYVYVGNKVTFETNGGSKITPQYVMSGSKASKPADPSKSSSQFLGWYKDADFTEAFDFDREIINEPVTVYAKWNTMYKLWIDAVQVSDANRDDVLGDGTVSFDPQNKLLTLNDAHLSKSTLEIDAPIYAEDMDLTITGSATITDAGKYASCAIYARARRSVGVSPNYKLNFTDAQLDITFSQGIWHMGELNIDNSKIDFECTRSSINDFGDVTITNSEITVDGGYGIGAYIVSDFENCGNMSLINSKYKAAGIEEGINCNEKLTVDGSDININITQPLSYDGISVGELEISSGTITAVGGLYSIYTDTLTMTGGRINATALSWAISDESRPIAVKEGVNVPDGWIRTPENGKIIKEGDYYVIADSEDKAVRYTEIYEPHDHVFEYSAEGNKITATCTSYFGVCNLKDHKISLTINKPTYEEYVNPLVQAFVYNTASLSNAAPFKTATGKTVPSKDIIYTGIGETTYSSKTAPRDAGSYRASITMIDNDQEYTAYVDYVVVPKKLSECTASLETDSFIYNQKDQTVNIIVKDSNAALTADQDFALSGTVAAKDAGNYEVTVTGINNYTGTVNLPWSITNADSLIMSKPAAMAIYFGETLNNSLISGGEVKDENGNIIEGNFVWVNPETAPTIADSNKTEYPVIFRPSDPNYNEATTALKLTVNKAKREAPVITDKTDESISGKNDGSISNIPAGVEYYSSNDPTIKEASGSLQMLSPGIYYFRYKADDNHEASAYTSVVINEGRKLTATFKLSDEDGGTILQTLSLSYQDTPVYSGVTPTKPSTAQYDFSFKGWDTEITPIEENVTYTARFTETLRKYHISFVDDDDSIISQADYDYGMAVASITPANPSKQADVQYTYTFAGWQPEIVDVKENATYKATYSSVTKKYPVKWIIDGTTETAQEDYGTIPTHADPVKENHDFIGWSPVPAAVTEIERDNTYTAVFIKRTENYTATWMHTVGHEIIHGPYTGTLDQIKAEMAGISDPTRQSTTQYDYTFIGWEAETDDANHKIDYYAKFSQSVRRFTITWKNEDGTEIYHESVARGGKPTYARDLPVKENTQEYSYAFDGWYDSNGYKLTDQTFVSHDETYTIRFAQSTNKYKITFIDDDGTLIKEATSYDYGTKADDIVKPADPSKAPTVDETYTFTGWKKEGAGEVGLKDVTADATYRAVYSPEPRKYLVTFNNADGTKLKEIHCAYGETPVYDGSTPTKKPTAQYEYVFKGWTPDITGVTADTTYTASYEEKSREYRVSFVTGIYDPIEAQFVEYGKQASKPADPAKKEGVEFDGWFADQALTVVFDFSQGITTNTAIYLGYHGLKHTVTLNSNGGSLVDNKLEVEYGKPYGTLPVPEKDDRKFAGWYKDNTFKEEVVASDIYDIDGDSILIARYQFPVRFEGSDVEIKPAYVYEDAEFKHVDKPAYVPSKSGYLFSYWAKADAKEFDFNEEEAEPGLVLQALYHRFECFWGDGQTWVSGDGGDMVFRFRKMNFMISEFEADTDLKNDFEENGKQIFIDDHQLSDSDYICEKGSLIVNLHSSYLNGLPAGKHSLLVKFSDGEVSAQFNVRERTKPSTPDYRLPKTAIE